MYQCLYLFHFCSQLHAFITLKYKKIKLFPATVFADVSRPTKSRNTTWFPSNRWNRRRDSYIQITKKYFSIL